MSLAYTKSLHKGSSLSLPLMRVGIFFGGASREREISFAGGRTVYDNLNKSLFEVVPVFVDSIGNFIILNWQYIYKGTIRDFYPPVSFLPKTEDPFQVYIESLQILSAKKQDEIILSVGKKITPEDFKNHFDFAFLTLHGAYGEDGSIQGLLDFYKIPYSGSGILPSAIGMNKTSQKKWMQYANFDSPKWFSIRRENFDIKNQKIFFKKINSKIHFPYVVKPANQGSSIGATVVSEKNFKAFQFACEKAFFQKRIKQNDWKKLNRDQRISFVRDLTDIRDSLSFPILLNDKIYSHPQELLRAIDEYFNQNKNDLLLKSVNEENEILIEQFIFGKEFSCIVIEDENGNPVALPPTEIVKDHSIYDYRSKYLAGLSRKVTPIRLPDKQIEKIRSECERLYHYFGFDVYARIDGFINEKKNIFLNDPNTTSGMLPSSFFFHQAAEIGMNPSQFLTYIIHQSLNARIKNSQNNFLYKKLLSELNDSILKQKKDERKKIRVAVLLGGYSTERHISVESGRNIYEKLASSAKYHPIPVFLSGDEKQYDLFQIPVNILLKDNADDIREKIKHFKLHPVVQKIKKQYKSLTDFFADKDFIFEPKKISFAQLAKSVDFAFIALHGRPGEDGAIQRELEKVKLPYNGSGIQSSEITINKFRSGQLLKENGLTITDQEVFQKSDWKKNEKNFFKAIENEFPYPFIAKPVDDGCSSAVKKINDRNSLKAYLKILFREKNKTPDDAAKILHLRSSEEFPIKENVLIEKLIESNGAPHFLEVTGGLLAKTENGKISYEIFQPSETLAGGEVLSLEEKFLAGEGQNITPARFATNEKTQKKISDIVRRDLEKAAQLLGVEGYSRVDAFVRLKNNDEPEIVVIEINSLPGMTPATVIFHQAALNGYTPYEFIDKIITYGFAKHRAKN
jgi:UDP-N-acetylmuramate--alanine ligase